MNFKFSFNKFSSVDLTNIEKSEDGAVFEEVDLYWLVDGKGHFPKLVSNNAFSSALLSVESSNADEKKIQRIVVFYTDGTFDEYMKY